MGANSTLVLAVTVAVVASATITLKYVSKGFAMSEAERVILLAGMLVATARSLVPAFLMRRR